MKVVVTDANILIDLVELGLLPHFFALEFEFLTTNLVLGELFEEQLKDLSPYIDNGTLTVQEVTVPFFVHHGSRFLWTMVPNF